MYRFWNSLIRPICDAIRPSVIVEVGCGSGQNTRNILAYCRETGARCHVIDPTPLTSLQQLKPLMNEFGHFHQDASLDALNHVSGDIFLIDGDHNWYTVINELRAIAQNAKEQSRAFPLIFLHDVHWPYGRRDLYYSPDRIPSEFRKPYARHGISTRRSELMERGGYNYKHFNALSEGGTQNGVLTAIEDFVDESGGKFRLYTVPGFHGLGILYAPDDLEPGVRCEIEKLLTIPDHLLRHLEAMEKERVHFLVEIVEMYRRLGGRPGPRMSVIFRTARRLMGGGRH